jgi:hypothetical protein
MATLAEWGLPGPAIMPGLGILGAPDDVLGRASDQMELHGKRTRVTAAAAVLGALAFAQSASAASPEVIRYGAIDAKAQMPNPVKWGAAPSGIRWSSAQPNPIKWGAAPEAVRYSGLQSFFRPR